MSDALQGISRASSQQWEVLSRASSLSEFEVVDVEPAPEVDTAAEGAQSDAGLQVEESCLATDLDEINCESEVESEFEEIVEAKAESESESESDSDCEAVVPEAEVAQESPPSDDEINCDSDVESEFEAIVPEAEVAKESPSSEAEHLPELPAPHVEDEVESLHSNDATLQRMTDAELQEMIDEADRDGDGELQFDDLASVASAEISETNPAPEDEVADESAHSEACSQFDKSDYTTTIYVVASAEIPEANLTSEAEFQFEESTASAELPETSPASEVGSSTRARHRRSLAPAEVTHFADTMRQNAKNGLSEAVRLIDCLDSRLDKACPHVVDGVTYLKQQVKGDFQSTAKDMRDAFGEGQESEPTVAASFSHLKDQLKSDFNYIRKDVDSAFGCILGSSEKKRRQKTLKTAVPAATCSIVSLAVASWLVPIRLARFAVANIAM